MNVDKILKEARDSDAVLSGKRDLTGAGSKRRRENVEDDDDKPTIEGMEGIGEDERNSKMQKILEEADDIEEFDANKLRDLVSQFTKAIARNIEHRGKFADDPAKFMDSEMKVHEYLQEMHGVAASPELYPEFVRLKTVPSILSLLPHENTDISIEVVDLLKELTEPESFAEDRKNGEILLGELIGKDMIPLLIVNLERLNEDEDEDKQAVHSILGIFENLLELAPEEANKKIGGDTKFMDWLLKRLRKGRFDENQLYASEILSMLLISSEAAIKCLSERGGLKKLVRCVALYRKKDPESLDEIEMVENLFNSMCAVLYENKTNQDAFAAADGLMLMVTMIRKKRYTQAAAVKVLNYAISENAKSCESLIDVSGLKAVFKAFMARGKKSKKIKQQLEESEEHILSCVVQLFKNLSDIRYLRLLNKFKENEYEKLERLVELHNKYYSKVDGAEREYLRTHSDDMDDEEDAQELRYMRRLDNGLYSLQLCAVTIALVCSAGNKGILERVQQLLNQQDSSLKDIKETLEEYHANVAEDEKGGRMKLILRNLLTILDKIIKGGDGEEDGDPEKAGVIEDEKSRSGD